MELDAISFLFGLMIIPFSVLFFPKIMFNKENSVKLFIGSIALCLVGLSLINYHTNGKPNFYLFLCCPLCSLALLKIILLLFRHNLHRYPKNAISLDRWGMKDDEGWDKMFYFIFMLLSLCLPVFMLGVFYPK